MLSHVFRQRPQGTSKGIARQGRRYSDKGGVAWLENDRPFLIDKNGNDNEKEKPQYFS